MDSYINNELIGEPPVSWGGYREESSEVGHLVGKSRVTSGGHLGPTIAILICDVPGINLSFIPDI